MQKTRHRDLGPGPGRPAHSWGRGGGGGRAEAGQATLASPSGPTSLGSPESAGGVLCGKHPDFRGAPESSWRPHTAGEPRLFTGGRSEAKFHFYPRNSHGMPVFVVTLGVIVCIPASADKKTTFDLQSRVAISRGLPRKAESQVPGVSPRWAQMGRAPATWGVSPDGAHGAGFCSRQPGTGR